MPSQIETQRVVMDDTVQEIVASVVLLEEAIQKGKLLSLSSVNYAANQKGEGYNHSVDVDVDDDEDGGTHRNMQQRRED